MRLLLFVLLACPKSEPEPSEPAPEAPSAEEPAEPTAEAAAGTSCVEACVQSRAMEARAPEAIEADCRAQCGADEAPVVEQADRLPLHLGQRVTVVGTLTQGEGGAMLELDGAKVLVDTEGYPHGWEGFAGKRVRVTGTLETRDEGLGLANPDAPLPAD